MKNIVSAVVLLILVASCQQQQKIAFIDNGEVINKYQMKIDIEDKYKLKDDDFKKRMDSVGRDFQIEAQAFQAESQKLSQAKMQERYQELGQKRQVLEQRFQMEQQSMTEAFNTEMDSVVSKVKEFVADYGKTNGYTFILGKNEAGSVMYGKESEDITESIITALNEDYKPE
ncbi:OmpH family outer membrane protein [Winogradskyella sp. A3E31]|uniref:OmpH family outer membrane protein n=1 Tax=Winogradskyella sp. A3E31 TaxID=3349637 RepID=UPI00398BA6CB